MTTLEQRMKRWKILEEDLDERFVLGSGAGGQKINKTSSCVYLKHLPTGVEVSCQETRSREKNREIARDRLCDHFEEKAREEQLILARERAKKRFQKRKPSRAEKARRRRTKELRKNRKQLRGRVRD
ncbi:MAG: peptide chain release factor-like protein [Verrucomicrobiales bacterium]|nr:peptide chain release factor-like protein [Verrucomicrobiales bacterium]